jgi:methionyl-tRNA formyltransferase
MTLRIVFMGTPDFAVPVLLALIGQGHDVVAAYTRAPRPAGRGMAERRSPVHTTADGLGIAVLTPRTLREEAAQATFAAHGADLAVVVAYGLILPRPVLDAPALGCLNLHASLLPRWRGAAPINRAIMAGDRETGVMAMRMDEGLDTGPVGLAERVAIGPDTTAGELHDRLAALAADVAVRAVAALERGTLVFTPQADDGIVYADKLTNAECRMSWARPARMVHDHVRGLSPYPGAYLEVDLGRGPERVKVLRSALGDGHGAAGTLLDGDGLVACAEGAVRLMTVQRAGGKPMGFAEFARGARLAPGAVLA